MSRFHPLRIAKLANDTRDAVVVTFEVPQDKREVFHFLPGQHLTLRTTVNGEEVRRSYSICSAPFEHEIRIAIKRVPEGIFSTWAHRALQAGQIIDVMEPSGSFHVPLESRLARHHVAFAAGSGITPILSIITSVLVEQPSSRVTLVYGNRASSSVIFKEDLQNLKDRYLDRFNLIFILSREHQDLDLFNGRIDRSKCDQLLEHWIGPSDIDVAYLCGPESMMRAVSDSLQAHGLAPDRIKQELFSTGDSPCRRSSLPRAIVPEQECRVSVLLDGRRREFFMPRNKDTLLDAALEQGVDLPYSCKGGVCSTCRCKLTQGQVDMDVHFALEDYEIERGYILACQSYPLTTELALDFDTKD